MLARERRSKREAQEIRRRKHGAFQTKSNKDLYQKRIVEGANSTKASRHGQFAGFIHTAGQPNHRRRGLLIRCHAHAGHEGLTEKIKPTAATALRRVCKLNVDRMPDVLSPRHASRGRSASHLPSADQTSAHEGVEGMQSLPNFCPAAVYEMVKDGAGQKMKINFANCVPRKLCDIADPNQLITGSSPRGRRQVPKLREECSGHIRPVAYSISVFICKIGLANCFRER